jgi:hypothetical protein
MISWSDLIIQTEDPHQLNLNCFSVDWGSRPLATRLCWSLLQCMMEINGNHTSWYHHDYTMIGIEKLLVTAGMWSLVQRITLWSFGISTATSFGHILDTARKFCTLAWRESVSNLLIWVWVFHFIWPILCCYTLPQVATCVQTKQVVGVGRCRQAVASHRVSTHCKFSCTHT